MSTTPDIEKALELQRNLFRGLVCSYPWGTHVYCVRPGCPVALGRVTGPEAVLEALPEAGWTQQDDGAWVCPGCGA